MRNKKMFILKILLFIIGLMLIFAALGIWVVYPYYSNPIKVVERQTEIDSSSTDDIILPDKIEETETEKDYVSDDIYKEEKKEDEIINVLLCGMDARNYETNSRSDTIMVASYNKTKHEVKIVSFMRDTWVKITDRGWGRVNSATAYGGTGLLINTINDNFDLDIGYYIQIKFEDFKKVIDALGGVEVELSSKEIKYINKNIKSEKNGANNVIEAEPGIINLNGAQALWHCRNRTIGNSDFERTERQRDVMSRLINKVIKIDVGQASKLIFDLRNNVRTNVPVEVALEICKEALINGNITIKTDRIPYDDMFSYANKNGASVIEIDMKETTEKLHDFLGYTKDEEGLTANEEVEVVTE